MLRIVKILCIFYLFRSLYTAADFVGPKQERNKQILRSQVNKWMQTGDTGRTQGAERSHHATKHKICGDRKRS